MPDRPRAIRRRSWSTRSLAANLRYMRALARRFRWNLLIGLFIFGVCPVIFWIRFRDPASGQGIPFGEAVMHVYFLLFGQPVLNFVSDPVLEILNIVIPPVGIVTVVHGVVGFSLFFFAKRRSDKEWVAVECEGMKDHVVICGAGRVGYRVASQLLALGKDMVVVDKSEDALFASVLRDQGVPVLTDDVRSQGCFSRLNLAKASAIVAATDDDLANLNIALDARRLRPDIRVVIRLFDDDLVSKVRTTFQAEALSSSALAAPALALAALDPRILHSFQIRENLMVVSQFTAGEVLGALTVGSLRDQHGAMAIEIFRHGAPPRLHPPGTTQLCVGDVVTVQCEYHAYLRLRALTGEVRPPVTSQAA